jgi:tetratricopeptide (TPR) repeat protein
LVDSGASIYSNVENLANKRAKERPVDWLSRFDNKLLTEEDKVFVNSLLEVPFKNELNKISGKLNLEGERLYAKGEFEQAMNKFKQAIATNNENIKPLNNFSLTALKLGYKGKSLKASYDVIQSKTANKRAKASAYFNSGLACEGEGYFKFDGRRYCDKHSLEYFISAYSTYPTKGRSKAIINRFKNNSSGDSCKSTDNKFEIVKVGRHRDFYFLHKNEMPEVFSNIKARHSKDDFSSHDSALKLTKKSTVELNNGYSISTYRADSNASLPIVFDDGVCTPYSQSLMSDKAKLIYVFSADKNRVAKLKLDVEYPYVFILSGADKWDVSETGSVKSIFIIDDGEFISPSVLNNTHQQFPKNLKIGEDTRQNKIVSNILYRNFGKPIYTKFKLVSESEITINDDDIEKPKLIVNYFQELKFYGVGDYQLIFTNKKKKLDVFSNLAKVTMVSENPNSKDKEGYLTVPSVKDYIKNNEVYFKVEEKYPSNERKIYSGAGFFIK